MHKRFDFRVHTSRHLYMLAASEPELSSEIAKLTTSKQDEKVGLSFEDINGDQILAVVSMDHKDSKTEVVVHNYDPVTNKSVANQLRALPKKIEDLIRCGLKNGSMFGHAWSRSKRLLEVIYCNLNRVALNCPAKPEEVAAKFELIIKTAVEFALGENENEEEVFHRLTLGLKSLTCLPKQQPALIAS